MHVVFCMPITFGPRSRGCGLHLPGRARYVGLSFWAHVRLQKLQQTCRLMSLTSLSKIPGPERMRAPRTTLQKRRQGQKYATIGMGAAFAQRRPRRTHAGPRRLTQCVLRVFDSTLEVSQDSVDRNRQTDSASLAAQSAPRQTRAVRLSVPDNIVLREL